MSAYSYNNQYLLKDGKPWFPVMGEIHYSRFRPGLWEESLRKMKAGGISIVSAYVIWIHHEEEEGSFDFSGCRNLKKFLQLCKKVGISVFLRLGPWVHGEVRNGGFPDWLAHREGIVLRSDDPAYLAFVQRYWEKVYEQAEGMMHRDGGPVIGIQIENEYGHVGGFTGDAGEQHMKTLTATARRIGFDAPLYTATGWGGACTGGLLPVMGGYCEAPWDQRTTELEANANFVFSKIRNDALIACDHHVGEQVTFREEDFPYLTAELGGGLQVTRHRRPVARGRDIGAMSVAKLGSGVALLGYYMYHGGSNPEGKLSTLQESRSTGYANDLPEINYDFNAPIRQFGTISDSYREIRLLAYFLQDFGQDLAVCSADIEPAGVKPEDLHTLRVSCRHDGTHGYVFFNNYQRRREMKPHAGVVLEGKYAGGKEIFPPVDIASGQYAFFPYRMNLDGAVLKSALATLLCRLDTKKGPVFVFYGDWDPQFAWEGEKRAQVLHLSRNEALRAARVSLNGRQYLIFSDDFVWEEDGKPVVTGGGDTVIKSFPPLSETPDGFTACREEDGFGIYERKMAEAEGGAECALLDRTQDTAEYEITITYNNSASARESGRDTLLYLDFSGESMDILLDGKKINDYFYTGQQALLSLGYFDFPKKLKAIVYALHEDDRIFLEKRPVMEGKTACVIDSVRLEEVYR